MSKKTILVTAVFIVLILLTSYVFYLSNTRSVYGDAFGNPEIVVDENKNIYVLAGNRPTISDNCVCGGGGVCLLKFNKDKELIKVHSQVIPSTADHYTMIMDKTGRLHVFWIDTNTNFLNRKVLYSSNLS